MNNELATYLFDIHVAIHEIESFLPERKDFNIFQDDIKTRRAIERNLEIIGEAVSRILSLDSNFPLENARRIVDTRNRIIHGYDTVSAEIIWSIVLRDLPVLKVEVTQLLNNK